MPEPFYRAVDAQLCQGDLFDCVPHLHVKPPLDVLRKTMGKGARVLWEPYPYPLQEGRQPERPTFDPHGEFLRVHAQFTKAILLTYDCDLDNEKHAWIVALVRPMTAISEEADRQIVRESRNFNSFYLPENPEMRIAEGYVDFRRITSVAPSMIQSMAASRLASLTIAAVKQLRGQLIRFITRQDEIVGA